MEPLEATMQGLVQHWYCIASQGDDSKKTKDVLYEETERVVSLLTNKIGERALSKNEIWELCRSLRNGFEVKSQNKSKELAKWIARNTRDDGDGKFEGAYSIFRKLSTVVDEGCEDRMAQSQSGMAFIDSKSLSIIDANKQGIPLSEDVAQELIYSRLSVDELKAMATDKASRNAAKNVLIRKINNGEIEIGCAEFPSVKSLVDFFCPRCSEITRLRSCNHMIKQIDFNFLKHFPNLTSLYIDHCEYLTDISALQHCNLTSLHLEFCEDLKDISGLQHCKDLTSLHLANCNKVTDFSVLQHFKKLTSFTLRNCITLTDISVLQHLKNLTSLHIEYCLMLGDIRGLQHLNLTSLNLSYCHMLTNIRPLLDSPSIRSSLRHLDLRKSGVQETTESLLKHFPYIVELDHNLGRYRKNGQVT